MAPYGIPNETPEQIRWMEKCIKSVGEQNPEYPESRRITICKNVLKRNNWKVPKSEVSNHRRITWGNTTI